MRASFLDRFAFLRTRTARFVILLLACAALAVALVLIRRLRDGTSVEIGALFACTVPTMLIAWLAFHSISSAGLASPFDRQNWSARNVVLALVAIAPCALLPRALEQTRPQRTEYRMPNGERPQSVTWSVVDGRYYATYDDSLRVELTREAYEADMRTHTQVMFGGVAGISLLAIVIAWAALWWPTRPPSTEPGN